MLNDKINDKKNDKITPKTTTLDHRIVEAVKGNKYITIPELAALTGKSEATIHRHLDVLVKSGKIARVGSRKTGFWDIHET
jgi:ATP-dependent DNA helicase RecG